MAENSVRIPWWWVRDIYAFLGKQAKDQRLTPDQSNAYVEIGGLETTEVSWPVLFQAYAALDAAAGELSPELQSLKGRLYQKLMDHLRGEKT